MFASQWFQKDSGSHFCYRRLAFPCVFYGTDGLHLKNKLKCYKLHKQAQDSSLPAVDVCYSMM